MEDLSNPSSLGLAQLLEKEGLWDQSTNLVSCIELEVLLHRQNMYPASFDEWEGPSDRMSTNLVSIA